MTVSGARPVLHWDVTFDENLSVGAVATTWTVHVGSSFVDVPTTAPFYPFIEKLLHMGVTTGCGSGNYCPSSPVTRAQMAVFLLKSRWGAVFLPPPATGTAFPDVPTSNPYARATAATTATGACTAAALGAAKCSVESPSTGAASARAAAGPTSARGRPGVAHDHRCITQVQPHGNRSTRRLDADRDDEQHGLHGPARPRPRWQPHADLPRPLHAEHHVHRPARQYDPHVHAARGHDSHRQRPLGATRVAATLPSRSSPIYVH